MFALYLLLGLLFLVAPLLGIVAYLRVNQLEKTVRALRRDDALQARVAALETEIAQLRGGISPAELIPPTPSEPPVEPVPAVENTTPVAPPAEKLQPAPRLDLENLIAGQWLNRIGLLALFLAASFFLKFAFDNNWIGPSGRVAIGLLTGCALIVLSQGMLKRGYGFFSDGLTGLGAGVLFLSLYAAHHYYDLIPAWAAFAGMVITTAALMGLALARSSLRIALLSLAGGFLTPALLSSGVDVQVQLFSYLALLNMGLLLLTRRHGWDQLPPLALLATIGYYIGWHSQFYHEASHLFSTLAFLVLFFVQFSALSLTQAQRNQHLAGRHILLLVMNVGFFLLALGDLLYDAHRLHLTMALLLVAASYLALMHLLPPSPARLPFAATALTAATLAIPVQLEGAWIAAAWAIEGAALTSSGLRTDNRPLRGAGLILLTLAVLALMIDLPAGGTFLFNPRLASFAILVAGLGLSAWWALRPDNNLSSNERLGFGVAALVANILALWGLSLEVWDAFAVGLEQMLALSLFWAAYATILLLAGLRYKQPALRWQSLALFGLLVGKVFLYDLSLLDRAYRIASFFVLGTALLAVSFFYQHRQKPGKES